MARQHGVITTISGLSGVCVLNSLNHDHSAEIAEARDESGKVTDRKAYSRKKTIQGSGLLDTSTIPPSEVDAGATLAVGTETYLIESIKVGETNTGYAAFDFTASRCDNETAVAYGAGGTGGNA